MIQPCRLGDEPAVEQRSQRSTDGRSRLAGRRESDDADALHGLGDGDQNVDCAVEREGSRDAGSSAAHQ